MKIKLTTERKKRVLEKTEGGAPIWKWESSIHPVRVFVADGVEHTGTAEGIFDLDAEEIGHAKAHGLIVEAMKGEVLPADAPAGKPGRKKGR